MKPYTPEILKHIREEIAASNGNEVFFAASLDYEGRLESIHTIARGDESAVPAILNACRNADLVVHNHPSGNLSPSTADLEIAGRLGEGGIAFHIINNDATRFYKVSEIQPRSQPILVDYGRIASLLGTTGPLATSMDNYEERPEQLQMALTVAEAFNTERIATIEAGTGTGKSLAYLIPALLWAIASGETVIVSTNTINLQEQLMRKDLPLLRRIIPESFNAVLVKGRANYLCLRRLQQAMQETDLFSPNASMQLKELHEWGQNSRNGSRDELPFTPEGGVWNEVCCEMDQCPRTRCTHYQSCFFHRARREAAKADLLVSNHALLLADLAVRAETGNYSSAAVLPVYARIIFDEAHHLEDAATSSFSIRLSRFSLGGALKRLIHPRKAERGHLARWAAILARELPAEEDLLYSQIHTLLDEAGTLCRQLMQRNSEVFENLIHAVTAANATTAERHMPWRITAANAQDPIWLRFTHELPELCHSARQINAIITRIFKVAENLPDGVSEKLTAASTDLAGLNNRLASMANELDTFLSVNEELCTWVDLRKAGGRQREDIMWLNAAPIEAAPILHKHLYERFKSVVMTSATLSVNRNFKYFHQRSGVALCAPQRRMELQLDSPFDFASQALIAVPSDLPAPSSATYAAAIAPVIEHNIVTAQGNTFVLFTAYSLLQQLYQALEPSLFAQGITSLCQGQTSRHQLLQRYINNKNQVLFGTDSFWEGVDVPGKDLELVIITRLPFRVPTEPIQVARSEALERAGIDPFMNFTVPQAAIKLKQGFGRLIRHRDDKGVVIILDNRVSNKGYGRIFLNSLPAAARIIAPQAEIQEAVREFFSADNGKDNS
ncbi:MAG: helicase C-terminal domain-containing protein [Desulfuromonadaceae bacterium]|nr:helicase C-terminal domain-containing protein [Desulfuromonadaceae bacterium]